MLSINKWKLATGGLALTTALSLYGQFGSTSDAPETTTQSRKESGNSRLASLQRFRLPAGFAGIDEDQLLRDLLSASTPYQVEIICERLGLFGSDRSVDPLATYILKHQRSSQYALMALGGIGSDSATEKLIGFAGNWQTRDSLRAIEALAKTGNPIARTQLLEWANHGNRTLQLNSIRVLGELGGEDVMELLTRFSSSNDHRILVAVVDSAAAMGTEPAVALIRTLSESTNRKVQLVALQSFPTEIDEKDEALLVSIVTKSDWNVAAEAAAALGRANATGSLEFLVEIAKSAPPPLRLGAIKAIAMMAEDKEVFTSLKEIVATSPKSMAYEAGRALLDTGDKGRIAFLAIMKKPDFDRGQLVYLLSALEGKDVDLLRMDIARNGSQTEKAAVLSQLIQMNNDESIEVITDIAQNGSTNNRSSAIYALSESSSPQAIAVIRELARKGGRTGLAALQALGDRAGNDPLSEEILLEAFYSGNPSKVQAASQALSTVGTATARAALVAALESEDRSLAKAAMYSVRNTGGNTDIADAFREVALNSKDKELRTIAMQQMIGSQLPGTNEIVMKALREGQPGIESILSQMLTGGSDKEVSALVDLALESDSPSTRAAIAYGLSNRGGAEMLTQLDKLTRDDDSQVKSAAISALANSGTTAASSRLYELALDESAGIHRGEAINVLVNNGDPRATALLTDALQSDDETFASGAISGSYNADPEVDDALFTLAENPDAKKYLRQQALYALSSRGTSNDMDRIKKLKESLESESP